MTPYRARRPVPRAPWTAPRLTRASSLCVTQAVLWTASGVRYVWVSAPHTLPLGVALFSGFAAAYFAVSWWLERRAERWVSAS